MEGKMTAAFYAAVLALFLVCCCTSGNGHPTLLSEADAAVGSALKSGRSKFESFAKRLTDNCVCVNFNCGCCEHIKEPRIRLDNTICANATYLEEDYGFSLTVTFDKFTIFNETMSLRNPPPVCIGAPFVEKLAEVCVRVYDIQASKAHLHACVDVEARMKRIHIAKYDLGCFNMAGEQLKVAIQNMENEIL